MKVYFSGWDILFLLFPFSHKIIQPGVWEGRIKEVAQVNDAFVFPNWKAFYVFNSGILVRSSFRKYSLRSSTEVNSLPGHIFFPAYSFLFVF